MTQKTINTVVGLGLLISLSIGLFALLARPKTVYVDLQKLVLKHKKMQAQLNENKLLQQTISKRLDTLASEIAQLELEKKNNGLSATEKTKIDSRIDNIKLTRKRYQEQAMSELSAREQKKMQEVLNDANAKLKEFGKLKGYEYILGATQFGNLLYAEEATDVTEDVIGYMNK